MNLLDRAIAYVAPQYAATRAKARTQMAVAASLGAQIEASYNSTGTDNGGWMRSWTPGLRNAVADTHRALPTLRAQSRDLVRNHPLAASVISTKTLRAVGTGLALSAQPNISILGWTEEQAATWRAKVHAEFSMWADSTECDLTKTGNFYDLQDLVLRSMLESGDCFTILPDAPRTAAMPYALRLQVIEGDRVGNPSGAADTAEVAAGVRLGAGGAPAAYHVYDNHPGNQLPGAALTKRFAGTWYEPVGETGRRRVLHHFRRLRPEQLRGVPDLAPVMGLFKLLGDYTDAEVKAAVVSAFLTVFIESDGGSPAPVFGMEPGAPGAGPAGDEIALGPAAVVGLARGEKANVVNPGRPNPAFGPFVEAVLAQLGAGTLIGHEMLMKRYNTSYVAARAAFLDAWKHLLELRTRIVRSLCQPTYETWMAEAVYLGRIAAPGFFRDPLLRWAYTRAIWSGDSQGSINPKDEVAAMAAAVDARLLTRERAEWELFGTDFQETYGTKLAEQNRLKKDGLLPEPKAGAAAPRANQPTDTPA